MTYLELMQKRYDAHNYNCGHFVVDAWRVMTGVDLSARLAGFMLPLDSVNIRQCAVSTFKRLRQPTNPCIVGMRNRFGENHIGVYTGRKVLHITQTFPEFTPIEVASRTFRRITYYAV